MLTQLVLAEFRERTRRYSFLVTLTFVFFFGLLVITGKYGIFPSMCRGEYNSAWVGSTMAISTTVMVLMAGFYLVKNSVRRDRVTGVGQILAASSLRNRTYLFAKFLSNLLALSVMAGVLVVAAVLMQLSGTVHWEWQLGKLFAPFLFITFPVIVLVAAIAVFFEAVRALNGAVGNVAYFFLMPLFLGRTLIDPVGFNLIVSDMQRAALAAYPDRSKEFVMGFIGIAGIDISAFPLFRWDGIAWTMAVIGPRLFYLLAAVLIVLAAVLFFDRFDTPGRKRREKTQAEPQDEPGLMRSTAPVAGAGSLTSVALRFDLLSQIKAEAVLLLNRVSWRWRIGAMALVIVQLAVPYAILRSYVVPGSWLWPLLVWSSMGARERIFNTESLVFSSPHPLRRQLPALWLAGFAISATTVIGALLRALTAGDPAYFGALLVGAMFIPTLALVLGMLSGSGQLFEVVYMFLWYIGPINHIAAFDFMAATGPSASTAASAAVLAITVAALPLILLLRRRRLGL